ncbi:MAG: hypothetical protein ACOCUR_01745 [Nanoarchaeota archaeon]
MKLVILGMCIVGIITTIILAFKLAGKKDSLGFGSYISTPIEEDEFK